MACESCPPRCTSCNDTDCVCPQRESCCENSRPSCPKCGDTDCMCPVDEGA